MRRRIVGRLAPALLLAALMIPSPVPAAQDVSAVSASAVPASAAPVAATSGLDADIAALQHDWAVANYRTPKGEKEAAFKALAERAAQVSAAYPDRAEPLVWQAIVLSGYAGALGGLSALVSAMPKVKQARDLLKEAERRDPTVLNGSVYTSLGSLYYMVPGWPVGFGDRKQARAYLDKAVATAPESIDANYFMGDFLLERKEYAEAAKYLERALSAPPRPGREVADSGRRAEARADLDRARKHLR